MAIANDWTGVANEIKQRLDSGPPFTDLELFGIALSVRRVALPSAQFNTLLQWIDNDGLQRAEDTQIRLVHATEGIVTTLPVGWFMGLMAVTAGVRWGDCPACGRRWGEHSPDEERECDEAGAEDAGSEEVVER